MIDFVPWTACFWQSVGRRRSRGGFLAKQLQADALNDSAPRDFVGPFSRRGATHNQCSPGSILSNQPRIALSPRFGYSMVELVVVLAILGLLVAITIPAISRSRASAKRLECQNNLRNLALAMTMCEQTLGRLPASGNYIPNGPKSTSHNHSWAVSVLPWIDQQAVYDQWDLGKPVTDPVNEPLTRQRIPTFICPVDISRSRRDERGGDLSYVVNGGVGFTVGPAFDKEDCPISPFGGPLDLNGDGQACDGGEGDAADYAYFKHMGLFFLENWKQGVDRHHRLADVQDGLTQTIMLTENVRAGFDPDDPEASYATPNPYRCAFYIGHPCGGKDCSEGNVDYAFCNKGEAAINGGTRSAEGRSPVPNSFHGNGVNMAFADGHVTFVSEAITGTVYAALVSPQGVMLRGTPLEQGVVTEGF
ncbi:MAG: DUF1559 domain-containing protein [Planctomycetaceae bacterium]